MDKEKTTKSINFIWSSLRILEKHLMILIEGIGKEIEKLENQNKEKEVVEKYKKEKKLLEDSLHFLNKALKNSERKEFSLKNTKEIYDNLWKFKKIINYAVKKFPFYKPDKLEELFNYTNPILNKSVSLKKQF